MRRIGTTLFCLLVASSLIACAQQRTMVPTASTSTPPADFLSALPIQVGQEHHHRNNRRHSRAKPTPTPPPGGIAENLNQNPNPKFPCEGNPICYYFNLGDSVTFDVPVSGYHAAVLCGVNSYCCTQATTYTFSMGTNDELMTNMNPSFSPPSYTATACGPWIITVAITLKWVAPLPTPTAPGGVYGEVNAVVPNSDNAINQGPLSTIWGDPSPHPRQTAAPTPSPGIGLFDQNLSREVTNTTPNAVVGQQQMIEAFDKQPGGTLSSCIWMVNGNTVSGYTPGSPAPTPSPTTAIYESFYWIGSGTSAASATAVVSATCKDQSSNSYSASATYTVQQPTFSVSQTLGNPYIETDRGTESPPFCTVGNECIWGGYPAASWSFAVTTPADSGSSTIGMAQLIKQSHGATGIDGSTITQCTSTTNQLSNMQYYLDNVFPYPVPSPSPTPIPAGQMGTWASNDAPPIAFPYSVDIDGWRKSNFEDFFLFKPAADNVGYSIWVTLASSNWAFTDSYTEQINPSPSPPTFTEGTPVPKSGVSGSGLSAAFPLPTWPATSSNTQSDPSCS